MITIETKKRPLYDILNDISKIKNKKDRADVLRNGCKVIGTIAKLLQLVYHPNFILDMPDTDVPDSIWTKSDHDDFGVLYRLINKRKLFNIVAASPVKPAQKERLFIEALESVSKNDSKLVMAILKKELPFKNLDEKFVKETLPELF